jgi:acyl carrier protein
MNVIERLQTIFCDVFDDAKLNITRETSAADIEDWDSISHITLVVTIEKEFNIKFALGELQQLKNVGEMIDLVEQKAK